jgi:glycosyltransferase involved in cell wall biosynthesis
MNEQKTVSIIMGTYNGEKYIREQLDSILEQTYPIKEIIIQDDGSTDGTIDICEEYANKHTNIRFSRNEHNLGFNLNFKSAAMKATGDYVAVSDQDDVWFPEKIAKQVEAIGEEYDICFSTHLRGVDMDHTRLVSPQYSLEALLFYGFAGHTMLFRRDFIQTEEYWIDKINYDWSLAVCAQLHRGIVMIDEPLNWHRLNPESACTVALREHGIKDGQNPTYQPYLYGIRNYRRLQQKPNWKRLYTFVFEHTNEERFALAHQMSKYMLQGSLWSLLRLCMICLKHGDQIYYRKGQKGLRGAIRKFFYPFIFSYNNVNYDSK